MPLPFQPKLVIIYDFTDFGGMENQNVDHSSSNYEYEHASKKPSKRCISKQPQRVLASETSFSWQSTAKLEMYETRIFTVRPKSECSRYQMLT